MGKKRPAQGGEEAQAQVVQNRDTLQRLNFLLQASTYLANAASVASASASDHSKQRARHASRSRRTLALHDLSRAYAQDIRAVGSRTVTRIDPAVKRAICKGCSTVLIPGSTSQVRILPSHSHRHVVRTRCKACGATRAIPCPPQDRDAQEKDAAAAADDADEKDDDSEEKQQPKRRGARGKVPFHERPGHIVFRGRERLTHPST